MPNLVWEKKLQEAVKLQQRFSCWVSEKCGEVLVQRNIFYKLLLTFVIKIMLGHKDGSLLAIIFDSFLKKPNL